MKLNIFGKNLRYYRNNVLEISQKQLGKMLYVSPNTISNWEQGRSDPNLDQLFELSKLFDISVDELLEDQF